MQLTIPFPFPLKVQDLVGNEEEFDAMLLERFKFWDSESTFLWFKARGYTLYQAARNDPTSLYYDPTSSTTFPRIPSERFVNASYPWPYHDDLFDRAAEQYSVRLWSTVSIKLHADSHIRREMWLLLRMTLDGTSR